MLNDSNCLLKLLVLINMRNGASQALPTSSSYIDLLCAFLGLGVFLLLYGIKVLDPTFINWTLKGDAGIHFLGWHFFRSEPWSFPLGAIKSYMYPQGTSLVFTDSIPLIAIPLKLFSSLLPHTFQYHGLWLLLTYILQGLFGAKLLRQITRHPVLIVIGVTFFLLSPIMTNKVRFHEALTSHWLLLAALYLYFLPGGLVNQYKWLVLLGISSLIHFYLFFMVGIVWIAYLLRMKLEGASIGTIVKVMLTATSLTLAMMWVAGYFVISLGSAATADFGVGSMNLLAPFFPTTKYPFTFLSPALYVSIWQHAGDNYLGVGTLLLIAVAFYEQSANNFSFDKGKHLPLLLASLVLLALAISNKITLSNTVLFEIKLPSNVEKTLSIIRASGRMFWPIAYLLIFLSIAVISKYTTARRAICIMVIMLIFQVVDLWPWYTKINLASKHIFQNPLQSPEWERIIKKVDHIAITPPIMKDDDYVPFALLAANHGKTINVGYAARADVDKTGGKGIDDFKNGLLRQDTLYVIKDDRYNIPPKSSNARVDTLDGYRIALTAQ